jgi:hypothetical protein
MIPHHTFSLAEGILEPKDITFIALLWDIAPLPKQNLYIEVDDVKKNLFKYNCPFTLRLYWGRRIIPLCKS